MDYMLHKYTGDSQRKPPGHSGLHWFQTSGEWEIHTSLVSGEICMREDMQMLNFPPFPTGFCACYQDIAYC